MAEFQKRTIVLLVGILCGQNLMIRATKTGGDDVRLEFLVPIQQTESGIELSLIPKTNTDGMDAAVLYGTKDVPDRELSPDCGDDFFRCPPLLVTTQNDDTAVSLLLVQLSGGLLLVELTYYSNKMEFGSYRILESSIANQCSPTSIFKVYDSYYMMCTNLKNKQIAVYEIRLNGTAIQQAHLVGPLITDFSNGMLDSFMSSDVMNVSNFLLSLDFSNQPLIYFAIDNYLFIIDLLDDSVYSQFVQVGVNCRHIHQLVRASATQILAYCSNDYVYYDTDSQLSVGERSYAESGVPYLCPNHTYAVIAFKNYLQYSIGSKTSTLSHVNIDNGICFDGTGRVNFFVYNDKAADSVVVIDLNSASQTQIPLCQNLDCLPIIVFEDPVRYLIIRQPSHDGRVNVIDIKSNFSTIISANHKMSEMYAVVRVSAHTHSPPPRKPMNDIVVRGVVTAIGIALLITTAVVGASCTFRCLKQHRCIPIFRADHGHMPITGIPIAVTSIESGATLRVPVDQEPAQGQPQYEDLLGTPLQVSLSGHQETFISAGGTSSARLMDDAYNDTKECYEQKNFYGCAHTDVTNYSMLDNCCSMNTAAATDPRAPTTNEHPIVHVVSPLNVTSCLAADGDPSADEHEESENDSANHPLLLD